MARLIQKSGYINAGKATGYMEYVATRDGVEIIKSTEPVTRKQERFIKRLLKDFPDAKELFEYSDYLQTPNQGKASAFIAVALVFLCFVKEQLLPVTFCDIITNSGRRVPGITQKTCWRVLL